MRYLVVIPFAVKTKKAGTVNLSQGQVIELAEEKAAIFLTENKIKEMKECSTGNFDVGSVVKKILNTFDGTVVGLSGPLKELYEERAAITELDGGLFREEAESSAIKTILKLLRT